MSDKPDRLLVNSVAKAFLVLEAFDSIHPAMTLTQIAERTGLDLSAAQRFAHTLHTLGYLQKDPVTRQFELSVKTLTLGFHYTRTSRLMDRAMPVLQHLSKETEETVNLTVLDGTDIVFISRFLSRHMLNTDVTVGSRLPAYCTAPGRAILSGMPTAQIEGILNHSALESFTSHTVTDRTRLMELIEQSRRQGYSAVFEELYHGDASLAAPITGPDRQVLGAVSIAGSTARYSHDAMISHFSALVIAAARSISVS